MGCNSKSRGLLQKQGMLVLEVFKGHFNTRNKNHISFHKHKPCGHTWVDSHTTPGVRSLECFKDHLKQLYNEWLLERNSALPETGKIGKPNASLDWGSSLHCGTSNQE